MKETKRIFISDLPETTTKEEIEKAFGQYGEITSTVIKERKELGLKNSSLFFAYVTLNINSRNLQNCFKDFSNGKWLGQHVMLQVAKESFLDRLRKERENKEPLSVPTLPEKKDQKYDTRKDFSKKYEFNIISSDNELENDIQNKIISNNIEEQIIPQNSIEHDPDFVIKNNRGKSNVSHVLKIQSVGREPIIKIDKTKKKAPPNISEANIKRLKSLETLKRGYLNQKSLIQAALANVDTKSNSRIMFEDAIEVENPHIETKRNFLFKENDSEEEFQPNFSVKDHFQGKQGQKLLELQSKYKNDERFTLNERFLEEVETSTNLLENHIEMSFTEEKTKEYEILGGILGKKIAPRDNKVISSKKIMLRFDPTQPEHENYKMLNVSEKKEKRKRKNSDKGITAEKTQEERSAPEVSKEVFFKVSDKLKQTFEEKKEFSLLNMFGNYEEQEDETESNGKIEAIASQNLENSFFKEKNPFRYESSDDEDQTANIPEPSKINDISSIKNDVRKRNLWTDSFFFKLDDYRLQEGFDFLEKMKSEEATEFSKLRRDLKGIVKAKVRNNLRKSQPFRKKLGGNRKKKILKIKKALKK